MQKTKWLLAITTIALAACATSGHKFTAETANSVKNGMTRDQVVKIMGGKPNSISDQGKTFVWSYAKVNGLTGSYKSRAVTFKFDDEGKTYGIPEGGAFGDIAKYQ